MLCEQSVQNNDLNGTVPDENRDPIANLQHQIIAMAYPESARSPWSPWGELYKRDLHSQLQLGFRWWKLACCVGHGILLIASDGIARIVYLFHNILQISTTLTSI
jgi:hypothetical protein